MIESVRDFFSRFGGGGGGSEARFGEDDTRLAVAALMVRCMVIDGDTTDNERTVLRSVLEADYNLSPDDLDALIADAENAEHNSVDLYGFTSVLSREMNREQRAGVIRQMWQVVFADGKVHEFENNLVWRVAELLGIDRQERLALKAEIANSAPGTGGATP